ncbi:hypothetical protein HNR72_004954 [Streptomyces collinus]|uniref:Uncharacterized protein n=1 Tax=Streptomyces collinus TaxID=42684 RepID=A0AA89TIJ1_STRCU|nr:hypothetical protein [Streptomyces collinus]
MPRLVPVMVTAVPPEAGPAVVIVGFSMYV